MRPELVAYYPEGAFIHIGTLSPAELCDLPELLPIIAWFRENYPNEKWIRLDRDGDIIEGVPQFQW